MWILVSLIVGAFHEHERMGVISTHTRAQMNGVQREALHCSSTHLTWRSERAPSLPARVPSAGRCSVRLQSAAAQLGEIRPGAATADPGR